MMSFISVSLEFVNLLDFYQEKTV